MSMVFLMYLAEVSGSLKFVGIMLFSMGIVFSIGDLMFEKEPLRFTRWLLGVGIFLAAFLPTTKSVRDMILVDQILERLEDSEEVEYESRT